MKMYSRFAGIKNIGHNNEVAAVTRFSYENMYSRFAGIKNIGRNNEVAVRRGSTV